MSAILLAGLLALGDEPTYPVVVELDNVCGRDCVAILEKALARIDGVKAAEMYGDKFHFKLEVQESKAVLPSAILKVVERLRTESKGEEDFPLLGFEATMAGSVLKEGDAYRFTVRGSGQNFTLKPSDALRGLVAAGKSKLTLTGKVTEEKGKETEKDGQRPLPILEVSEAKETPRSETPQ